MSIDLHPTDAHELRHLGEALCDFSSCALVERFGIEHSVETLVLRVWSDCSRAGVEAIVDRLLGFADWRSTAENMAEAALVEILIGDEEAPT